MTLSLLSKEDARLRLEKSLDAAADGDEALFDLLRAEVHARGQTPRAVCLERVIRLLEPAIHIDGERVAAACEAIVREGDVVVSPGGTLNATPLRAVIIGNTARLFSSLPTRALSTALASSVSAQGATRVVAWSASVASAITDLGGLVVTPEAWAGLERSPRADEAFLHMLDQRLEWEALGAGAFERDGVLDWRSWKSAGNQPGWQRGDETGRLWWARRSFGGHRRAWTSGGSPATHAFVELTADETDRARFSLMRETNAGILFVERQKDETLLEIPSWLPRPEYRWLSLHAKQEEGKSQTSRWRLYAGSEAEITRVLFERLGLVVEA